MSSEKVVVLGASPKKDRYSNKAIVKLLANGHSVIPVNPYFEEIDGLTCIKSVSELSEKIDTVTVYLNRARMSEIVDEIIALSPNRIIMNPGTESAELKVKFEDASITVLEACTLVMLATGAF